MRRLKVKKFNWIHFEEIILNLPIIRVRCRWRGTGEREGGRGSFISFRLDNCIFYHIRLFILSWQFIVEKHKRLIVKSISLKHSFLFTLRLFSCERKKREERRGEFFQIENQLWAAWPGSTVEFEYERKMMNRSTALLIGPIVTV